MNSETPIYKANTHNSTGEIIKCCYYVPVTLYGDIAYVHQRHSNSCLDNVAFKNIVMLYYGFRLKN